MRRLLLRTTLVIVVVAVILLPFAAHRLYRRMTALPDEVVIATGPQGGRYRDVGETLAAELRSRLDIRVKTLTTDGSLENLRLLDGGRADFILYQRGMVRRLDDGQWSKQAAFVANLYPEVMQFVVRADSEIDGPDDLPGKRVALGKRYWGEYAMSQVLLDHFGLSEEDIEAQHLEYAEIRRRFEAGTLDAAFMTAGLQAPIFRELYRDGLCRLLPIPYTRALTRNHVSVSEYRIPDGLYAARPQPVPRHEVPTVTATAQLLTRRETHTGLVAEVTRLLLSEDFLRKTRLADLAEGGRDFASGNAEFRLHPGARNVYEPELKPFLNPDFVEATEGLRSFVVSILIAGFIAFRWFKERREKNKEHRLDRYLDSLLELERRQIALDIEPGADDRDDLQRLLDELTVLRQKALRDFTADELSEDHGADSFIEMCHALSNKINGKLLRQRIERCAERLAVAVETASAPHDHVSRAGKATQTQDEQADESG